MSPPSSSGKTLTVASSVGLFLARLPGADPVPLVLDGVDLHPDATALLHATVATLVPLVLVNDALALKPEAKNRHSFFPKYTYCIAETGYLADKAGP